MTEPAPIDNAQSFPLTRPVNLPQLEAEIRTATASAADFIAVITGPADATAEISADNPAALWLAPASLDTAQVSAAIAAHDPDPNWGIPSVLSNFNVAYAALMADPEAALDDAGRDTLLRGIIAIVMGRIPPDVVQA